jgi:hypothetical protein
MRKSGDYRGKTEIKAVLPCEQSEVDLCEARARCEKARDSAVKKSKAKNAPAVGGRSWVCLGQFVKIRYLSD